MTRDEFLGWLRWRQANVPIEERSERLQRVLAGVHVSLDARRGQLTALSDVIDDGVAVARELERRSQ